MSSSLKLVYWPIHGRALPIRLAAAVGKVPLEDELISFQEWPSIKETFPFGSIPVLKTDFGVLAQSNAILSYIGKQGGLYPKDPAAAARVDEILNFIEDITNIIVPSLREQDQEKRLALRKVLAEETFPKLFGYLERYHDNLKNPKYLTSNELTVADLKFFSIYNWFQSGKLEGIPSNFFDSYKNSLGVAKLVGENEAVKNYLANTKY